jgi:hypothetical protein
LATVLILFSGESDLLEVFRYSELFKVIQGHTQAAQDRLSSYAAIAAGHAVADVALHQTTALDGQRDNQPGEMVQSPEGVLKLSASRSSPTPALRSAPRTATFSPRPRANPLVAALIRRSLPTVVRSILRVYPEPMVLYGARRKLKV